MNAYHDLAFQERLRWQKLLNMKIEFRGLEFQNVVKHTDSEFRDAPNKFESLDEVAASNAIAQKENLKFFLKRFLNHLPLRMNNRTT